MPIWHGYWGGPWGGFGWLVSLLGLAFMVVMVVVCMRRMRGMPQCRCAPSHGQPASSEIEALRREVQELREELRALRGRS
jgi:hypothetical protein